MQAARSGAPCCGPQLPATRSKRVRSAHKPQAGAASVGSSAELQALLAAQHELDAKQAAAAVERKRRVEQLLADSAKLEASMEIKGQEWGQGWAAMQGRMEQLKEPVVLPESSPEHPPSWLGPLVAAWSFVASSLHQKAAPQQSLASWLTSHVVPLGTLRMVWSAAQSRMGGWAAQQPR